MTRKQKHLLARIVIAAILFFAGSLFYLPEYMEAGIFLICYIVVGSGIFKKLQDTVCVLSLTIIQFWLAMLN